MIRENYGRRVNTRGNNNNNRFAGWVDVISHAKGVPTATAAVGLECRRRRYKGGGSGPRVDCRRTGNEPVQYFHIYIIIIIILYNAPYFI